MTFEKKFATLKTKFDKADVKALNGEFAIEFTMTDEDCGGIFYIKSADGAVDVQPYNYFDNNAAVSGKAADIAKIAAGIVPAALVITGDADVVTALSAAYKSAKPAAKKTCAKKSCAKTATKTAAKTSTKTASAATKAAAKTTAKVAEKTVAKETEKKACAKKPCAKKAAADKASK